MGPLLLYRESEPVGLGGALVGTLKKDKKSPLLAVLEI